MSHVLPSWPPVDRDVAPVDNAELCDIVEALLDRQRGAAVRIARFERRPSPYRTSAVLEELDVELTDGSWLPMMFKDAGRDGMLDRARRVKPAFLHDPRRELAIYRQALDRPALGTPHCYGGVIDEGRARYWLFLERVPGVELYQVGELSTWTRVAAWLGSTHVSFDQRRLVERAGELHLLRYDGAYYRLWWDRARFLAAQADAPPGALRALEQLAPFRDPVIDRLAALPATLIHGELYASNVLVQERTLGWRVCPVDWETAAAGPGVMDLAALTAGWGAAEACDLAVAYHAALAAAGAAPGSIEALLCDLACCRIQTAVQWFGWFSRDEPPAEHARDWLGDALCTARDLRL